jgi:hypothetical protein
MKTDQAGDKAYFTSIDPSGEKGQRPPLLLPTPDESRNAASAALWLGTKIPVAATGSKLIEAVEGRVTLLTTTKNGLQPQEIGTSIEAIQMHADIRTIAMICEAVEGAVGSLSPEERECLNTQVDEEDIDKMRRLKPASLEYDVWVKMRNKIKEFLSQ